MSWDPTLLALCFGPESALYQLHVFMSYDAFFPLENEYKEAQRCQVASRGSSEPRPLQLPLRPKPHGLSDFRSAWSYTRENKVLIIVCGVLFYD